MSKIIINNVNLEFDIFELENAQKFEDEMIKIQLLPNELKESDSIAISIKTQCYAVFNFIDVLYGKDKHKEVFGESVNLKKCLEVFTKIVNSISEDKESLKLIEIISE